MLPALVPPKPARSLFQRRISEGDLVARTVFISASHFGGRSHGVLGRATLLPARDFTAGRIVFPHANGAIAAGMKAGVGLPDPCVAIFWPHLMTSSVRASCDGVTVEASPLSVVSDDTCSVVEPATVGRGAAGFATVRMRGRQSPHAPAASWATRR